jgi:hypothetical protein
LSEAYSIFLFGEFPKICWRNYIPFWDITLHFVFFLCSTWYVHMHWRWNNRFGYFVHRLKSVPVFTEKIISTRIVPRFF